MICYFDASAFVKLVLPEAGSVEALDLWRRADRVISSRVLYPEGQSALARARRSGRVRPSRQARVRRRLEVLWSDIDVMELMPDQARRAGVLAEERVLTALDAVHLASAATVTGSELVFVASDLALLDAARGAGLTVAAV